LWPTNKDAEMTDKTEIALNRIAQALGVSAGHARPLQQVPRSRAEIIESFAPYDTMDAFGEGFSLAMQGIRGEKYDGVQAQAWDRGQMAAALCERHGL
jgi:hypothetical protein